MQVTWQSTPVNNSPVYHGSTWPLNSEKKEELKHVI